MSHVYHAQTSCQRSTYAANSGAQLNAAQSVLTSVIDASFRPFAGPSQSSAAIADVGRKICPGLPMAAIAWPSSLMLLSPLSTRHTPSGSKTTMLLSYISRETGPP
jgi:hypothetical protein